MLSHKGADNSQMVKDIPFQDFKALVSEGGWPRTKKAVGIDVVIRLNKIQG